MQQEWEWSSFHSKEEGPDKIKFTADSLKSKRNQKGKRPSTYMASLDWKAPPSFSSLHLHLPPSPSSSISITISISISLPPSLSLPTSFCTLPFLPLSPLPSFFLSYPFFFLRKDILIILNRVKQESKWWLTTYRIILSRKILQVKQTQFWNWTLIKIKPEEEFLVVS